VTKPQAITKQFITSGTTKSSPQPKNHRLVDITQLW